ncbi:CYTH-like domain-containing protein [Spironucleus salmonicida]|uniref:CYTH-like domain-containing protein n=1 Tax=Spironucleus salmonicida TaxID=348837 RepID=V6LWC8_9EUKA|nr:CYTH-like domain-containing protein [Spironucleus salmonicida]|eukprot:EST48553.1 CYTH-like domain-containing protein [Spironucleus salmonicida]
MEQELKITLFSSEDLVIFISSFKNSVSNIYSQENRYFTSPYLTENKIAFRVRQQDSEFILTEKSQLKQSEGYFQCNETNTPLDITSFKEFTEYPDKFTNYKELTLQAIIKTIRTVIKHDEFHFECDSTRTEYPYKHDIFEIECETQNPDLARTIIYKALNEKNLKYQISKKTKLGIALSE